MKVLVTGSRGWDDEQIIHLMLDGIVKRQVALGRTDQVIIVHGDAVGADTMAENWVKKMRKNPFISVDSHRHPVSPEDWKKYGKAAGHIRNHKMADEEEPNVAFAFWDGKSPGTKGMISYLLSKGIKTFVMMDPKNAIALSDGKL